MKTGVFSDLLWDDLRILLEVSRHDTLSAVSRKLGVDQTTVSRHIARIEAMLDTKIIDRSKAGITVRPEAIALVKHVENMEWHARAFRIQLDEKNEDRKVVRIATMEGLASGFVARHLASLHDQRPEILVELLSTPFSVDIARREADIFISFFNPDPKGRRSSKIAECSLNLYCSEAYRKKKGIPKHKGDLSKYDYVGYISDALAIDAVRWLEELIPLPHIVFRSNSILAQCHAACDGLGIVMLPKFVAWQAPQLHPIKPEAFFVRRDIWLSLAVDPGYRSAISVVTKYLSHIFEQYSSEL